MRRHRHKWEVWHRLTAGSSINPTVPVHVCRACGKPRRGLHAWAVNRLAADITRQIRAERKDI